MFQKHHIEQFNKLETPFYFYDLELLQATLAEIKSLDLPQNWIIHYALKANANPQILKLIAEAGFGADCVSGGEVEQAINNGFSNTKIVFAGVGKADWEINLALDNDIHSFNVESLPELEVINDLAKKKNKIAKVALRLNPDLGVDTHRYIRTGGSENKFGINKEDLPELIKIIPTLKNIELIGIHLHIGSQILNMDNFKNECLRMNEFVDYFESNQIELKNINVGGGLGIDYQNPSENPIPDFKTYFEIYKKYLNVEEHQTVHFELGRSIVGQCGSLISKVLYVKKAGSKQFVVLDAGMTELIRPALYRAFHKVENLSSNLQTETYDIVGPICESSDVFNENYKMSETKRGDIIAIRSTGAYGEVMASRYNMKNLAQSYYSYQTIFQKEQAK